MKSSKIFLATLLSAASLQASATQFEVTIQNLTKGQPITPPVVVSHSHSVSLFKLGSPATNGLSILAQDGVTSELESELSNSNKVFGMATGSGVILPGQSATIILKTTKKKSVLSVVGMLARTNDAIIAVRNIAARLQKGQSRSLLASVYDAGAEQNTETCATIPAPPCNNPGVGTEGGEGFVRLHEGIVGVGDLDLSRDTFALKAAKVTIKRID